MLNSTLTEMNQRYFDWTEYVIFGFMFGVSILIGIYFGFYKGGQKTISEYLLGNRQMTIFPITMSLISSHISGITLLGVPTEIYTFGAQYGASLFSTIIVFIVTLKVFLPVFYKLQIISLYEYLELRFNHKVRVLASLLFTISMFLYIPIVIYGPALALNQVSGMPIHLVTPVICTICIFYTTLGGLKAVVWADAVQGVMMHAAVFGVVILGVFKAGGWSKILEAAAEGDRLNIFNMDPDPTLRMSFWSATVGLTFTWMSGIAINPAIHQRFTSLPTLKQAKVTLCFLILGIFSFTVPCIFLGLIMYAMYKDCDPFSSKLITRPDQIVPYFVLDVTQNVKGLPAVFVVGVCSAALSTMSTGINTMAGTIYEDFIEPCLKTKVSEEKASNIMKVLAVMIGVVCVILVFMVEKLGALLEMSNGFSGVTSGAMLGVFLLGVLFPPANAKGALVGGCVSLAVMSFMIIGSQVSVAKGLIKYSSKLVSTMGCPDNVTHFIRNETSILFDEAIWSIHKVSVFYYGFMGCVIVLAVGIITTYLSGPTPADQVNPDLLSPIVHRFLPKKNYESVPLKNITANGNNVINNNNEKELLK